MRLGELLLQKGILTKARLETALHEQGRYGGRLGTNLIELGYVDVDTVALALSVQHGLPALRREHLSTIDARALALFPASIATKHKAIPIGFTMAKPARLVVACMDPATVPADELTFAAGTRLELWIAPEALVLECLAKYFGGAPVKKRYVSVKVEPRAAALDALRLLKAAVHGGETEVPPSQAKAAPPSKNRARVLSPPPPPMAAVVAVASAVTKPMAPVVAAPAAARPVLTLDPPPRPAMEFPPGSSVELPAEEDWDIPSEETAESALPLTPPPAEPRPVTAPPEALRPIIGRPQASMLIEMATSKEQIGRALEDWLRSTFGCGLVLIVKADMAIGWRGFFRDAEDLIEAVAVPLGKPSMFSVVVEKREPFRGPPPSDGAKVQELLWKLLRCAPPTDVIVCPVVLGKRAVNLVYAHMEDGSPLPESALEDATALCADAATAYARLIGRDRKKR